MSGLLFALLILTASGVLAALFRRSARVSALIAVGGCVMGCLAGLVTAAHVLIAGSSLSVLLPWSMPGGSFALEVDALSAFFLCAILGLSLLSALYGYAYLDQPHDCNRAGSSWFWFNLLIAGMALVAVARNGLLFLLAWEVMSLASFFLVAYEHDEEKVRRAAWIYLVATHLGAAFLLAMFALIGARVGSLDFAQFPALRAETPAFLGLMFVLALIGFGTKAGFFPLHVWLPEAHPAAPSHVSALMSGVMIKTGIYGLLRILTFLGTPPSWWGWTLIAIGAVSGVLGVVFALGQHDLKRLLAYSSVENIGIVALGLGVGLLGWSFHQPLIMIAGFAGGLLHVLNHSLFKGLLFLGAGSVLHATGCRDMERMGGLMKRMPVTGATFLVGAAAISGLPPLNGFVGEFLIYIAAVHGVLANPVGLVFPAAVSIGALALIGGLAAACFTRAVGIVFLGEPRTPAVAAAHESSRGMQVPMLTLATLCVSIGLLSPALLRPLLAVVGGITGEGAEVMAVSGASLMRPLVMASIGAAVFWLIVALVAGLRRRILRARTVTDAVTWDCGYAAPTSRMQYTASSFSQPITDLFGGVLRPRRHADLPKDLFPRAASFATHAEDAANERLYRPLFAWVEKTSARFRWVQEGRVQVYVLYIALTLLALLVWAF